MLKNIEWSEQSVNDFQQILEYLSKSWNSEIAFGFIEITEDNILRISKNPMLHPLINKDLKIRKCVVSEQNSLFYKIDGNVIFILRIFDTRQNPDTLVFDI